jgi:hypothetical protein
VHRSLFAGFLSLFEAVDYPFVAVRSPPSSWIIACVLAQQKNNRLNVLCPSLASSIDLRRQVPRYVPVLVFYRPHFSLLTLLLWRLVGLQPGTGTFNKEVYYEVLVYVQHTL